MLGQDDNPAAAAKEAERARAALASGDLPPEPVAGPHPAWDPRSYPAQSVPERMAIKGFETGRRFVCYSGFPKYVALYDLTSLETVSDNPEYSKATGNGVSAWTHRLRTKVLGRFRFTGTQIYPGKANMGDNSPVIRLLLLRGEAGIVRVLLFWPAWGGEEECVKEYRDP